MRTDEGGDRVGVVLPFRKPKKGVGLSSDARILKENLDARGLSTEVLDKAYRCLYVLDRSGFNEEKLNLAIEELNAKQ